MAEIHRIYGKMGGRPKGWRKYPPMVPELVKTTGLRSGRVSIQLEPEEWAFIYREASLLPRHCGRLQVGKVAAGLVQQGLERLRDLYGVEEVDARVIGREPLPRYQRDGFSVPRR